MSKTFVMKSLQGDLSRWFGYDVSIETRAMPYFKLIANETARRSLPTKGGATNNKEIAPHGKVELKNVTVASLLERIQGNNRSLYPFVDETGIMQNIDISMDCIFT